MQLSKSIIILIGLISITVSCQPDEPSLSTLAYNTPSQPTLTETRISKESKFTATQTIKPSPTKTVTSHPTDTATSLPTDSPTPTATPPPPAPLSTSGGGVIAFSSGRDGNDEIYVMNADGSGQRRLTDHPFSDTSPAWSPDGAQIAFVSARDRNRNIYIMNRDGSNLRLLTEHTSDDINPVWSPDGMYIGFISTRDGSAEVYRINVDGSKLQRLTQNSYDDWEFEWSPDSTQIAISSQKTGYANIYLMNAGGSGELQQLTDTEAHDVYPRWSPDGKQIAFASNRDGNWEIYIMNRNGGNQRRLTNSDDNEGPPSWSPDGTQLIFDSGPENDKSIFIMNSDGTNMRRLTEAGRHDWGPAWTSSPVQNTASQPPTATTATTVTPIAESFFGGVRVHFIANAGFLITVGDQRILIDAIYQGYPGGILKPILDSQPPFDGVDLMIATHEHLDHFDPELVLQYLQINPETMFISTPNAVDAVRALDPSVQTRLIAVELSAGEQERLTLAGIDLEVIHLSHGMTGILNLGFIINLDGVTLFHMGDMDPDVVSVSDLRVYGLPEKQIDIAFVNEFLFSEEKFHAHISEGIQAGYLIPMHFGMQPPVEYESNFPNTTILEQPYESWEMP